MTNGEKIKLILKPREYQIKIYGDWVEIEIQSLGVNFSCSLDWWNAEYIEPTPKNDIPHCQYTDEEIAKSFIEDVEAVKDQLPTTKNDLPKYCDRNICLKNEYNNVGCEDCEVTKSQEPTPKLFLGVDCISRQAVLDLINADWKYENLEIEINNLPSVTPQEPRKGHWILRPNIYGVAFCSECGFELKINDTNYCPNCGVEMEGEE